MSSESSQQSARPSAGRRVALAVVSLALLSIMISLALLGLLIPVAGAVGEMRDDEQTLHDGLMLGVSVREQYMHEAHTLIETSREHLAHHHAWVEEVGRAARALENRVPPSERWRVRRIALASAEIDRRFRTALVPAMERGDLLRLRSEHREVDALVRRAASDSDRVAEALEQRMRAAHVRAEAATQAAVLTTIGGAILVLVLAVYSFLRVRARVLTPLASLAAATKTIPRGDVPERILDGDAEVHALGRALVHMAEELRERERRLVASERLAAVGQLAAGVAHEVNNPIGIIRGYLRTMIPEAKDETLQRELHILDEEARACQRIAEDLVAFARTDDLTSAPMDPAVELEEAARRMESSGQLGAASLDVELESVIIDADAGRLRQVAANLLRNAAQATQKQGASVEMRGVVEPDAYLLSVADRGPGVPAGDRDRIFEPFFSQRSGGTGLGLAVCLGVVRAHGGTIRALDREGGGTIVEVRLPRSALRAVTA